MTLTGLLVYGQTFDVASVKPAVPPPADARGMVTFRRSSGGPGSSDPGRITYPNMSLKNVLMNAYDVKNFQIAGPAWLDTERFDIEATMPPETTKEQFRSMLQNLLAERFKMTVHRETRELPMYALVVAKSGLKMKESVSVAAAVSSEAGPPPPPMPSQPKLAADGFPVVPVQRGLFQIMMPGRARMVAHEETMQDFVTRLTNVMSRPVTDATGLTAMYDFVVTYSPEGLNYPMPMPGGGAVGVANGGQSAVASGAEPLFDIFAAVQSELGLKLEAKKGPVETIVIDHAEKTPTEN